MDSTLETEQLKIAIIGGSGLGQALLEKHNGTRHDLTTPFGRPSDVIIETTWNDVPVLFLSRHGPGHTLNPSQIPFRANIAALKQLGCTHIIASGAVGSLREEFKPRDLVIPDQVIDKTHRRSGTFYDQSAVHVEFAEPFCPVLRKLLLDAAKTPTEPATAPFEPGQPPVSTSADAAPAIPAAPETPGFSVHDRGCYVCMEGPAFSTRAESLMHRLWGGDLIGMTAMPEAKLAREAEISYALVALVTDYDCWRQRPVAHPTGSAAAEPAHDPALLLKEIIGNLQAATDNAIGLIQRAIAMMNSRRDKLMASPARHALRLAIWSDKSKIDPAEVERLHVLWGKYFTVASATAST